jgi:PAS domain S-box-containing protein
VNKQNNKTILVLIVDDDATMRLLMRHTLKKAGFDTIEAADGQPAIELFQTHQPDIILLDVLMPEMDGFKTCHAIRQLPEGKHVPILLVTGLDDMESINNAYEAGATDFITKPITFPLLSHRVRYVLRSSNAIERVGKSESRLAHAQEIAHIGNWEWDLQSSNMHWSDQIYHILGLKPDETISSFEAYLAHTHIDDQPMVKNIAEARHQGNSFSFDHRILRDDNVERIVHVQGEAVFSNEHDAIILLNGTVQDITARKQAENELHQYRAHLEELVEKRTAELTEANENLQDAKEQAEQANELKEKFVNLVAHDLRSPMAGIISALEYMHSDDETPLPEEHQGIVERLSEVSKSLVKMIEDVLNIGRLKSGKIVTKPTMINLHQSIESVINNLGYSAKRKSIVLQNDVPNNICFYADETLYGEVIQNLTSNAIKFCQRDEYVRFFLPENSQNVLAVTDNGLGMKADLLPKLFKIEEKTSQPGTAGEQGTGFGLPFSQDIMLAHGGTLRVESTLGEGTTFYIDLPSQAN